jgi:hypothetical protein
LWPDCWRLQSILTRNQQCLRLEDSSLQGTGSCWWWGC